MPILFHKPNPGCPCITSLAVTLEFVPLVTTKQEEEFVRQLRVRGSVKDDRKNNAYTHLWNVHSDRTWKSVCI